MSLSTHGVFESLVIMHIITGTVGLISVWIPIAGQKGGRLHRQAGNILHHQHAHNRPSRYWHFNYHAHRPYEHAPASLYT